MSSRSPFLSHPNGYMLFSILIVLRTFLSVLGGSIQIEVCPIRTGPVEVQFQLYFIVLLGLKLLEL
jgi:hypothetical protein